MGKNNTHVCYKGINNYSQEITIPTNFLLPKSQAFHFLPNNVGTFHSQVETSAVTVTFLHKTQLYPSTAYWLLHDGFLRIELSYVVCWF